MAQKATQARNLSDELELSYESDATASFLVARCKTQVSAYQAKMLERNDIRNVIPVEVLYKEGKTCFYYNITSLVPLSLFLKRRKFSRDDFLKFLLNLASSVRNSTGYLLSVSNFVFNPEYIYINPGTLEPALVYIPVSFPDNGCDAMQRFISDLLLMHVNTEGFDEGNIVQRLLAAANSEEFKLKSFIALLNELLYGRAGVEKSENHGTRSVGAIQASVDTKGNYIGDHKNKVDKKKDENQKDNADDRGKTVTSLVIPAILLQFLMGGLIFIFRDALANIGGDPTVTYAAVAMIVLAVDVLLFKKAVEANLINLRLKSEITKEAGIGNNRENNKKTEDSVHTINREGGLGETTNDLADEHGRRNTEDVRLYELRTKGTVNKAQQKESCKWQGRPILKNWAVDIDATGIGVNITALDNDKTLDIGGVPCRSVPLKTELLGNNISGYPKGVRILRSVNRQDGTGDIVIDKDDFLIGRLSGHVDCVINNNAVGKLHAELIYRDGTCYVKDLNSMNGTYINGKRIESNKEFELRNSDRVQFANSEFIFMYM